MKEFSCRYINATLTSFINFSTGVKRIIGGNMDLSGKKTEGKLLVKYDTTPISTTTPLTILDTDYDNYAVIWSCNGLGPIHAESAWLMTRERIPDAQTLQTAYGVLDRYKISRTFFVKTDQEGCAVAASDLNAALGIASTSTNVEQNAEIDGGKKLKSTQDQAQTVPEYLLKGTDEEIHNEEKLALKSTIDVSDSLKALPQLTPEDNNDDIKRIPEERQEESFATKKLSTPFDSPESQSKIESVPEDKKKGCLSTNTTANKDNAENNNLIKEN